MYKNTLKLFVCILTIFASSCSKLDLLPVSSKSAEGFYSNKGEIDQALIATYEALGDIIVRNQYAFWMSESRSDNIMVGLQGYDDTPFIRFTETSALASLSSCWGNHFHLIFLANKIIESLDNVELESLTKDQFEGEAKFLRAMAYFNLVRYFGGVPLLTKTVNITESYNHSRSSIDEVYQFIEADLIDASLLLPQTYSSNSIGRATKFAAKGMLGKTYMFQSGYPQNKNKWNEAISQFREIIDSGNFSFFDNYNDIFQYENELGSQSIFSIRFLSGFGIGNPFPLRMAPGIPYGSTDNYPNISNDLLNSFEEGDLRKTYSVEFEWIDRNGELINNRPFIKKYNSGPYVTSNSDWDIDWIVLRYTDVLLMYSEAINEISGPTSEALSILNQVRERAGLDPKPVTDDKEIFRLWMEEERRHEFCFENIRWFDLVRTDRALSVMQNFLMDFNLQNNFPDRNKYLYPLPQRELNLNENLEQNPGH